MMRYSALIRGAHLVPRNLKCLADVKFDVCRSPGEIINGRVLDYGVCSFARSSIEDLAMKVKEIIYEFSPEKLEFIEVNLTYKFESQCNLEFSGRELDLIREIGGCLTISCYQEG